MNFHYFHICMQFTAYINKKSCVISSHSLRFFNMWYISTTLSILQVFPLIKKMSDTCNNCTVVNGNKTDYLITIKYKNLYFIPEIWKDIRRKTGKPVYKFNWTLRVTLLPPFGVVLSKRIDIPFKKSLKMFGKMKGTCNRFPPLLYFQTTFFGTVHLR